MVQSQLRFQPNPNVIFSVMDGEAVLLDLKTEGYFSLDKTGTRMWQLLEEFGDFNTVIARMLDEYDVDEIMVKNDLIRFSGELEKEGLLVADK